MAAQLEHLKKYLTQASAAANSKQQTTPSMSPSPPPATSVRSQTSQRSSEAPTLPERRKVDEALTTSSSSRLTSRAQEENPRFCSVVVSKEMLADRLHEYKLATIQWKQAGDLDKARTLLKKVKLIIQFTKWREMGLSIWIEELPPAHPRLPPGASYVEKQAPERQNAEETRTTSFFSRLKSLAGKESLRTSSSLDEKGRKGVEQDLVSMTMLEERLFEYRLATVKWKQAGDLEKAEEMDLEVTRIYLFVRAMESGLGVFPEGIPCVDVPRARPPLPRGASYRKTQALTSQEEEAWTMFVREKMLKTLLCEYIRAAVRWKQAGDLDKALNLTREVRLIKGFVKRMESGLSVEMKMLPPLRPPLPPRVSYAELQASTAPERQKAEEARTASSSSRFKSGVAEETFQTSHAVDAKGIVAVERDANLLLPPAAYPEKQGSGSGHSSGAWSRATASPQGASSGAAGSGMASPQQVEDLIKQYNNAAIDAKSAGDKVKAIEYMRQVKKYEKARDSGRTLTTGSHSQTSRSPEKSATHVHRPTHSKNSSGSTRAASATHGPRAYVRFDSPLLPPDRSSSTPETTVGQSSDGRDLVDSQKDMKLERILESLNLLHWLPTLRDERVDEEVFMDLSEEDLLGLNFKKLGERRRFLKWQKISKTSSRIENENQMKYEFAPKKAAPPPLAVQKKVTHSSVDLSDLTCPITLELMKNPVILFADGHTYEKEALDQWFATGRRSSPVTGVNIVSTNYETNWAVKKFVRKYLEENPQFKKHAQSHVDELNSYRAACALRERDLEMAAAKLEGLRIDNDELKMKAYKSDEILAAVQKVGAQVDAGFASLSMRLSQLGLEIFSRLPGGNVPRLFVVLPEQWFSGQSGRFARMRGVFTSQWRVLPLCEGNDTFSECHVNPYHDGYRISMTRPWLRKALPVIKVALKVVCIGIQAGSAGAINLGPLANLLPSDPKAVVELSNALSRSVGMLEDNLQHKSITSLLQDEDLMRSGSAELANLLSGEFDKTAGLQQMYNGANQVLWVCRDHTRGLIGVNRN